jgi:endonuclease/exonuclease/phosphatase family metal-dependent hydrolase
MAKESNAEKQIAQLVIAAFMRLPLKAKAGLVALVLIIGVAIYAWQHYARESQTAGGGGHPESTQTDDAGQTGQGNIPPPQAAFPPGSKSIVFCVWNMENLFDDVDNHLLHADEEFDRWFAHDPEIRKSKYQQLTTALLKMNGGIGPDIIVGNEAESVRSAELLKDSLNTTLPAGAAKYDYVAMKELTNGGRHISPCIISRYPISRAQLLGHRQRILEAHVSINGHDLLLVASHWTSQLSDDGSHKEGGRNGYASLISDVYRKAMLSDSKIDFLLCGDFNDTPDSESVHHTLHMVSDYRQVTPDANPPRLFGLLSGKSPDEFGTIYYKKPLIYDNIGVSPGMFDNQGWGYDPGSVSVPTDGLLEPGSRVRHPWRFGSPKETHPRGFSDHLPVVVTLKVAP